MINKERVIKHICKEITDFMRESTMRGNEPVEQHRNRKARRCEFILGQLEMMFQCDLISYGDWSDITYWMVLEDYENLLKWTNNALLKLKGDINNG